MIIDQAARIPATTIWLRLEGAAVFALALVLYSRTDSGWLLFLLVLLAPDLSMLGYLAGPRIGAVSYNLFHSYLLPIALVVGGLWIPSMTMVAAALVWIAHIGMDRMLGYGLKLPGGFQQTHLGTIGRRARPPPG